MNLRTIVITIAAVAALSLSGCKTRVDDEERLLERGDQFGDIDFSGYVLDGVTGRIIGGYELELVYANKTKRASVNRDTNRFTVGGLPEAQDYAIRITREGYRPFESSNAAFNFDTNAEAFADGRRGFIYVAYLYPTAVTAPDTKINVFLDDSTTPVAGGSVRLTPTNVSSLLETDIPAVDPGMNPQVWQNTLDVLSGSQTVQIAGGSASFPGADLVYGVTYDIDVFGVQGYQTDDSESVDVGNQLSVDVALQTNASSTLQLIYDTRDLYRAQSAPLSLVFVFNRNIEFSPTNVDGVSINAIDYYSSFNYDNFNTGGNAHTPITQVYNLQAERGFTISVVGNTLVLTANRAAYASSDDTLDRVTDVTFAGFDEVVLRPVGSSTNADRTLESLNGGDDSVTINIAQE